MRLDYGLLAPQKFIMKVIKMDLWFTSDTHFGHKNIIEYCNRPFKSLEEMDTKLIRYWNERVKKGDMVIFLGDFCFRNSSTERGEGTKHKWEYYREQLNGEIVFIQGNHDGNNSLPTKIKSLVIEYGKKEYFCTHKPIDNNTNYAINLVGHVHNDWKVKKIAGAHNSIIVNVGVDVWNYRPVKIEEILKRIKGGLNE